MVIYEILEWRSGTRCFRRGTLLSIAERGRKSANRHWSRKKTLESFTIILQKWQEIRNENCKLTTQVKENDTSSIVESRSCFTVISRPGEDKSGTCTRDSSEKPTCDFVEKKHREVIFTNCRQWMPRQIPWDRFCAPFFLFPKTIVTIEMEESRSSFVNGNCMSRD